MKSEHCRSDLWWLLRADYPMVPAPAEYSSLGVPSPPPQLSPAVCGKWPQQLLFQGQCKHHLQSVRLCVGGSGAGWGVEGGWMLGCFSMVFSERCSLYNLELPNSMCCIDRLLFIVISCLRSILHMSLCHQSSARVYYPNLIIQRRNGSWRGWGTCSESSYTITNINSKVHGDVPACFSTSFHVILCNPCSPCLLTPKFLSCPQHLTFHLLQTLASALVGWEWISLPYSHFSWQTASPFLSHAPPPPPPPPAASVQLLLSPFIFTSHAWIIC